VGGAWGDPGTGDRSGDVAVKVRNDLYAASVSTQRTRAVDTRQDRMDMEPVPVR
jgi:hypothetical protein